MDFASNTGVFVGIVCFSTIVVGIQVALVCLMFRTNKQLRYSKKHSEVLIEIAVKGGVIAEVIATILQQQPKL